jgi:hypothetical protein
LTGWNLEVVAELQVIGEAESVCYGHVSEALEEVHLEEFSKGPMVIRV